MLKSVLLDAIRTEIRKHDLSHFQEDKIVQPGCPRCRKQFYTVPQFIDHLTDDVLPLCRIGFQLRERAKKWPSALHRIEV